MCDHAVEAIEAGVAPPKANANNMLITIKDNIVLN
jgi:hypothetical protein